MTHARNYCCHGNATVCSIITVGVDVAVNNIKFFNVVMEMQQWVSFVLLSSCRMFHAAVNSNKYYILRVCAFIVVLVIRHVDPIFYAPCCHL